MADFKLTIKSEGTSHQRPYIGKDGQEFTNLMIGAVESKVINLTGKMIAQAGLAASERVLWLSAIYFQRLISRTPRDENYTYYDDEGNSRSHKDDEDYMQDYWTARYWNYQGITAKYLRESCGCNFETFNDPREIEIIYREFRDRFFGAPGSKGRANKESGKTTLKSVRFYCDYPKDSKHELRYHLLEYGGFTGDGIIKRGNKRYHGVVGDHSVQAPYGMTALTNAEFVSGQFKIPSGRVLNKNILKYIGLPQNVTKELDTVDLPKVTLSSSLIDEIMRIYGVGI